LSMAAMVAIRMVSHHVRLPIQLFVAGSAGTFVYIAAVWMLEPNTVRDS